MMNPELLMKEKSHLSPDLPWGKTAWQIMNDMWADAKGRIFHNPVDVVKFKLLDYHKIVKRPMDYSTVKTKMRSF